MNNLTGIIATSLLVCSLAGPARAELSEPAATAVETTGHPLSAPGKGSGETKIESLLDRFAGTGSADLSTENARDSSLTIVPPISETTLYSAFTRAGSPMNSYYSRSGSDDKQTIAAISRSAAFIAPLGGDRFVLPNGGLAANIQGYFVGSGAVVGAADITPMQSASSGQSIILTKPETTGVPLPLPFLLSGSGLAALLALRKRAWING